MIPILADGEPAASVGWPGGSYIQTFSGAYVDPFDPKVDDIHLQDIAHALSNQCRFTGHVREFYAVSQHVVLVARLVPAHLKWAALLHDASEAYLCDLARPIKNTPTLGSLYRDIEDNLMRVIARKFGFAWPLDPLVKEADETLLRTELRDLMHNGPEPKDYTSHAHITPVGPTQAKTLYLLALSDAALVR